MAMTDADVFSKLNLIFQDVLDDDELHVFPATTVDDVGGWDSLAHVRLMLTVQSAFQVKFAAAEIRRMKNVGDLLALIRTRVP